MDGNNKINSCGHGITIENFVNGEIYHHSLFIGTGRVTENQNLNHHAHNETITITNTTSSTKIQKEVNKDKTFKFIIKLKLGQNVITFATCFSTTEIIVEHKLRETNFSVTPLYIICKEHDGTFQAPKSQNNSIASAQRRIITGCKLIQSIFAETLYEFSTKRKTFNVDPMECLVFHSELHFETARKMGQTELWYYFAREIMMSPIGSDDKKYLAFLSCTKYNGEKYSEDVTDHGALLKITEGYVAFGGNGLALLGTACLYTWPESVMEVEERFQDMDLVDRTRFLDDSCFRGTLGGCFSTTLGATLHELCHTFGLGHSDTGIMGRGFDNVQQFFLAKMDRALPGNINTQKTVHSMKKDYCSLHWTASNIIFLNYHKWFNDYTNHNKEKTYKIEYDPSTKILKSNIGLRLIEIRRKLDEMVLCYWVFKDKVLKYSFQIQYDAKNGDKNVLVVEDNEGNVLKYDFS